MENGVNALSPESVDSLLDKHKKELAALRNLVQAKLPKEGVTEDGVKVDELFLLRYVLSNKKSMETAAEKVLATLEWRRENVALLISLAKGERHPLEKELSRFLFSGYTGSLGGGEPISVVRMGLSDFRTLMNTYGVEEVADYLLYEKERAFRICDQESRERGRIVKSITIIDFASFTMFGGKFDNRFFTALGGSSKSSSVYFPQLQAKTVAINTPSYYSMVHKTLSAVMPKSSMEKMVMCPAKKTESQSADSCPFMKQYLGTAAVPKFLGGTGLTPRELMPPDQRDGELPFESVKLQRRSYTTLELPIEHRDTMVEFEVMVDGFHIYVTAEVVPWKTGELESMKERQVTKTSSFESTSELIEEPDAKEDKIKVEHYKREKKKSQLRWKPKAAHKTSETTSYVGAPPSSSSSSKRLSLNPKMAPLKLSAKDGLVKGTWKVPILGRLLIKFDNSFSRLRSKTVTYRIVSVPPPEDEGEKTWWESNWQEFASQAKWPSNQDDDWSCTIQ